MVEKDFPLEGLTPGTWTDLTVEAEVGHDRGNCGVAISGGWDGMLIDRFEVREVKPLPEANSSPSRSSAPGRRASPPRMAAPSAWPVSGTNYSDCRQP